MTSIIYELPLNERLRTLLRLDFLFKEADHALKDASEWGSRAAIDALIDILNVFVRSDIKSDLVKELERIASILTALEHRQGVNNEALGQILLDLERLSDLLQNQSGQIGNTLKDHEFLNCIRQRNSIPGGTCDFDLPAYHHWLHTSEERRRKDLSYWLGTLSPLKETATLLLHLIRESASRSEEVARVGFFQKSLDTETPFQLIRVSVPGDCPAYAEISGGKHRFSIRFMNADPDGHVSQVETDTQFSLLCCAL